LPFLTLRVAAMASVHFNADLCLALVRPEHGPFYKRVFGSEIMSDVRTYPGLHFPVALFGAPVENIRTKVAGLRWDCAQCGMGGMAYGAECSCDVTGGRTRRSRVRALALDPPL
jgi:hypothetical protein